MLQKTRGIAINYIKYRDTSIISRIYTEDFGLQSYIVNGVRSAKSKGKMALYQPLTLLDLVIYHKDGAQLNRISEIKCFYPYQHIPFEIRKTTIGIFLGEVLSKIVRENEHDHAGQFDFVAKSLQAFDTLTANFESFHLQFLVKFTQYLGFDLVNSEDLYQQVYHLTKSDLLSKEVLEFIEFLYNAPYAHEMKTTLEVKREALKNVISFYDHHLGTLGSLKSVEVLRQILH
ncbi:DNA repair protein RecO [Imperialibacter roseus]|uniref:DNA repair protein RecO n=1 Tax=Imperialibacter roseus TaxID=1324217 RepID=A0ABZ0INE2_9BACT|nr:DNA repair protein RecO [Imperialibacter roseus]WOK06241.1 DNA repair protein RecO [Imperialibacter roseus]|tara:strand:+ start:15312 stop:16004 length:693 start_codon:yes stop_codon:yes gene_type:complete